MSTYLTLTPPAGIITDVTPNAATGGWVDCNHIRFRDGRPEKIGGWVRATATPFVGTCRSLWTWVTLGNEVITGVGTHKKFYLEKSGVLDDITPLRLTVTVGSDPFATTAGSDLITVTHAAHGAFPGDYVTFSGATAFGDVTALELNQELMVVAVVDGDTYQVSVGSTHASTASGGGASVQAAYQVNTGSDSVLLGAGWGAGVWGRDEWGGPASSLAALESLRLWTQENWGEDLLLSPRGGGLYVYDVSAAPPRATAVTGSDVPDGMLSFLVSPNERIVLALGCSPIGETEIDRLLVRWCDYEDYTQWTPASTNAAGGTRLNVGSEIITGARAQQEILVWTDEALFAFSFVGVPSIFQVRLVDSSVDLLGPNAVNVYTGTTYWMGRNNFYIYDGRVRVLPCSVKNHVLRDLNYLQKDKVTCGVNAAFNEVWWFYPSAQSQECDRYVIYNTLEQAWSYGELARTAWLDAVFGSPPVAAYNGRLYYHETGLDAVDVHDAGVPEPLAAFVESAPFELEGGGLGRGDKFYFVSQLVPDVDFRGSTAAEPTVTYTFRKRRYPGLAYADETTNVVQTDVGRFTETRNIRLRSRALAVRVSSSGLGVEWRLGDNRLRIRTDGEKA